MRDKDSHLIFESYKGKVLLNEAAPLLLILVPPALAFVSGKIGFTSGTLNWIKKKTNGIVDIQAILDIPVVDFVTNIVDITGLTYWPKLEKSLNKYESDPSPENFCEIIFDWLGTFPVIGTIRRAFAGIESGKTALKELPIIYKFLASLFQKSLDNIFKKPEFLKMLKKVFSSSPKQVQQRIIALLSVVGTKRLIQELLSSVGESAAESAEKTDSTPQSNVAPPQENLWKPEKPAAPPAAQPAPTPFDF